jgi:hypothetical protein
VRYDSTVEDRGIPQFPEEVFVLSSHGFICVHPNESAYVVGVEYSQRAPQGETLLPIDAEGESFLESLSFTPR